MKFPTDSKGNVVVEWDKQNERYQWTRDITHEFIVFPPSCNSYVTIYPPNDTPKSDLPPGFVRIRDLEPGDYYVATGYRPALTAASLIPDNIGRLKKKATKNHSAEISTQGGLTLHEDSDTPVYPIDASFALKGERVSFNDSPKPLPPGAVRLDSLKWDDIFSLSDIIDPYTLRVVVHRRCCPEGDSRPFSHKYQGTTYDLTGHDPSTPVYPVEASFTLKGEPVTFPSCWTEDRVAPGPPHYVAGHAQAEAPHNPVGQAQMNAPAPEPKVDPESAALNRWEEYAAGRGGKPHPPK